MQTYIYNNNAAAPYDEDDDDPHNYFLFKLT